MINQLLNFISDQKLFRQDQKILLAVSGGIDSMVLADLFSKTKFSYAFAHCNFGLRGEESDGDQSLVVATAKKYGVNCFVKSFETEAYAKKHGISIQMSARKLRRDWFQKLMRDEGYARIATAHHLNDSLETILFNLAKGTGISGLHGILPKSEIYIRPLMFASREMIADYAKTNELVWREDRSNSSVKYRRNLIRHNIVPELKKINPALEKTFAQSLEKIKAAERIYQKEMRKHIGKIFEITATGYRISKASLLKIDENQIVLYEILKDLGFNFHQAKDIILNLNGQPGKTFFSPSHRLVLDRNFLFIHGSKGVFVGEIWVDSDTDQIETPSYRLTFEKIDVEKVRFSKNEDHIFVDYDKLIFPLKIRTWQRGERFQPLGMRNKKKLSDFMIDEKIPLNLKEHVPVLFSEEIPVWVIGYRIDDRYKITKNTRVAFSICKNNRDDQSL